MNYNFTFLQQMKRVEYFLLILWTCLTGKIVDFLYAVDGEELNFENFSFVGMWVLAGTMTIVNHEKELEKLKGDL